MTRAVRWTIIALVSIHCILFGYVILNRLTHTAFNMCEGTDVHFAYQCGEGMDVFGQDDLHVQQLWYFPLIYQITGLLTRPFHYDIRAVRLVALFFGLGSVLMVGLIVHRQTNSKLWAFVASALMSGIGCDFWFIDLGPDAPHVFFALLAIFLLIRKKDISWPTVFGVAVSLYLSFWSKQTGLAYIFAGAFCLFVRDIKKGLAGLSVAIGLSALSIFYYAAQPGSTFIKTTMLHGNHPMIWSRLWEYLLFRDLFGRFSMLIAAIMVGIVANGKHFKRWLRADFVFLGASAVVGLIAQCKYGSGPSQAILLYGMIIVCGITSLQQVLNRWSAPITLILPLIGLQSLTLLHDLTPALITAEDQTRFEQVLGILAMPDQEVYYINQGYLNVLVGKQPYAWVGRDCWDKGQFAPSLYPEYFQRELSKDPFDVVIIDDPPEDGSWFFYQRLNQNYTPVYELPASGKDDTSLRHRKTMLVRNDLLAMWEKGLNAHKH